PQGAAQTAPPPPPPADTAMPAVRHTPSTSRLEATANGSGPPALLGGCDRRARPGDPARARTIDGPAAISKAAASKTAAVLMPRLRLAPGLPSRPAAFSPR